MMAGEIDERLVQGFFGAIVVALEFDEDVICTEQVEEMGIRARGQADQALGKFDELFVSCRAFSFFCAHLHACDQSAQVLVAGAIFGQQRVAVTVRASDFGADVRAEAGLFRGHVEAGGAGDVIAVQDREGRESELGGTGDQFFGDGGAFEEAESRAGVQFNIRASHSCLR